MSKQLKYKDIEPKLSRKDVNIEKIITKYHGFFKIDEYQLSHKLFNGEQSNLMSREIFERGDAVVLMPYDPFTDQLVLNEQFRPGALRTSEYPWLLEFVAGMFEPNEQPIDVAIREAKEEAGLTVAVKDIIPIMQYLPSPGGTSESIHLYVAKVDASQVKSGSTFGLASEDEDIKIHLIDRTDALAMVTNGKINNAATIIGVQWLALNYQTLQQKWK